MIRPTTVPMLSGRLLFFLTINHIVLYLLGIFTLTELMR